MTWALAIALIAAATGAYHAGSVVGAAFLFALGAVVITLAVRGRLQ